MVGLLRGVITHYPTTMSTTLQQLNNVYYPTSLPPYSFPAALLHSLQCIFATQQVTEPSKSATFSSVLRKVDSWL